MHPEATGKNEPSNSEVVVSVQIAASVPSSMPHVLTSGSLCLLKVAYFKCTAKGYLEDWVGWDNAEGKLRLGRHHARYIDFKIQLMTGFCSAVCFLPRVIRSSSCSSLSRLN